MSLFDAIGTAASGLSAERLRMDVVAENLANAQSTRGADGQPYRRKVVVLQESGSTFGATLDGAMRNAASGGVRVAAIAQDATPNRLVYDPGHPDADERGYVSMPNVQPVTEMVDLITASRGYEANVTVMQTTKQMFTKTLEILR
ncbi:MAG TPA: flagellar basal body rod protein FlgC [Solirubrobacteraceae bacterium]|nr:flagellar basal body rod protein FlgC [Solirubrobacteraceae bacterium]